MTMISVLLIALFLSFSPRFSCFILCCRFFCLCTDSGNEGEINAKIPGYIKQRIEEENRVYQEQKKKFLEQQKLQAQQKAIDVGSGNEATTGDDIELFGCHFQSLNLSLSFVPDPVIFPSSFSTRPMKSNRMGMDKRQSTDNSLAGSGDTEVQSFGEDHDQPEAKVQESLSDGGGCRSDSQLDY